MSSDSIRTVQQAIDLRFTAIVKSIILGFLESFSISFHNIFSFVLFSLLAPGMSSRARTLSGIGNGSKSGSLLFL